MLKCWIRAILCDSIIPIVMDYGIFNFGIKISFTYITAVP